MTQTTAPADLDIDRGFVRLPEALIHYRSAGDAADPPLIMLHASPSSSRPLVPLIRACAGERRVLAPDTLGNGASSPPPWADPSLSDYAGAMDAFAAALGHDSVDVYGAHTGAHIAIEWALAAPGRVRRVILDGVAVLSAEERAEYLERYAPPQRPDPSGAQFHWAWHFIRDQMIFYPHYKKDAAHARLGGTFDAGVLHELTLDVLSSLETYHLAYRAVFRHDVLARLPLLPQRVLWLASAGAPLEAGSAEAFAAIPNAVKREAPEAAGPAARAAAIAEFLR